MGQTLPGQGTASTGCRQFGVPGTVGSRPPTAAAESDPSLTHSNATQAAPCPYKIIERAHVTLPLATRPLGAHTSLLRDLDVLPEERYAQYHRPSIARSFVNSKEAADYCVDRDCADHLGTALDIGIRRQKGGTLLDHFCAHLLGRREQ
jgi:hypothetical protein